jgi:thiol-disulfide isomerase/thioredoxin
MKQYIIFLAFIILSCRPDHTPLQTGVWRGTLSIQDKELPFNFSISKEQDKYIFTIHNASERIRLDSLVFTDDSLKIFFPVFDASFRVAYTPNSLNGTFTIHYANNYTVPFTAVYGQSHRFVPADSAARTTDFSGTYAVDFINTASTVPAVFIVSQQGNYAEATFLTPYGDYRYLEGNVVNDTLWLSAFDGNHLYIFNATLKGDSISGTHWLGRTRKRPWKGVKNELAKLPPPESLTYLKKGYDKLEFTFPDITGKPVSLQDEQFRNKVVIVQILGTWCPNCVDETSFLANWYRANKQRGVEIIGLAYEQKEDFAYASARVKALQKKLNVTYPILIAGVSDNAKAAETLPALNAVIAFPTTIFIGRDGKVKHIHTGFSGPGTGKYYNELIDQFNEIVNTLLSETPPSLP